MNEKKGRSRDDPRKRLVSRRDFLKTVGLPGGALTTGISGPFFRARAAQPEIRIGHATALTGIFSVYGPLIDKGLRLAILQSKYRDRVKFFVEDSQAKAEVAAQKAAKSFIPSSTNHLGARSGWARTVAQSFPSMRAKW